MKLTTLLHLAQRLTITGAKLLLILYFFLLWRCDPTWVMASSFLRFVDHTQRRTTVGRTPVDEWSARRREIYLTTHNNHNRQISMPPVGFEPIVYDLETSRIGAPYIYIYIYIYIYDISNLRVKLRAVHACFRRVFTFNKREFCRKSCQKCCLLLPILQAQYKTPSWKDPVIIIIIISVALRPNAGHGLLILEVSRSHTTTHQSVGFLWTSDQLVAESSTWQHITLTTDKHPCPRWDSNPRSQQASGRRPTS